MLCSFHNTRCYILDVSFVQRQRLKKKMGAGKHISRKLAPETYCSHYAGDTKAQRNDADPRNTQIETNHSFEKTFSKIGNTVPHRMPLESQTDDASGDQASASHSSGDDLKESSRECIETEDVPTAASEDEDSEEDVSWNNCVPDSSSETIVIYGPTATTSIDASLATTNLNIDALLETTITDASSETTITNVSSEIIITDASLETTITDASSETTITDASSETTITDATNTISIDSERISHRSALASVDVDEDFLRSPAVSAVKNWVPQNGIDLMSLILTAVKFFIVDTGRLPEASGILSILDECDFSEEKIVDKFIALSRSCGGLQNIPYFKNLVQEPNQHDEVGHPIHDARGESSQRLLSGSDSNNQSPNFGNNSTQFLEADSPGATILASQTSYNGNISTLHKSKTDDVSVDGAFVSLLFQVLKKEKEFLEDAALCVMCKKAPPQVTFLPCGHFIACSQCSEPLHECSRCKKKVLAEAKTFFS